MRSILLVGLIIAACHPPPGQETRMEASSLQPLLEGELAAWRGLGTIHTDALAGVLGPAESQSELAAGARTLAYHHHRARGSHAEVRVGTGLASTLVEIVDVFPDPAVNAPLGTPDAWIDYDDPLARQQDVSRLGAPLREAVFAARGLAVLVLAPGGDQARVVRVRGFQPMDAGQYQRLYASMPKVSFP